MEDDTEVSTVKGSKDGEIHLISRNVLRKIKEKVFKRRNWLIHNVKVTLKSLLKNLFDQKI